MVRAETAADDRYAALVDLAARIDPADAVESQRTVLDALALVRDLDEQVDEAEHEQRRIEDRLGDEATEREEEFDAQVAAVRTETHAWRAMVARVLGLSAYDERILTLDDADARLRGVLR